MHAALFPPILLPSDAHTTALAQALAPHLGAGDVLALWGEIGAGKSHFARGLIRARLAAMGRDEDIPSPTFTLVQTYDAGDLEIWHSDLYRLTSPDEVLELGLDDAFDGALCLIEWPDRLGPDLPPSALHLHLAPGPTDNARILTLRAGSGDWAARLAPVLDQVGVARA
jgi:tRNA threonylcarbamoyladenosine biosynthesis protein TsaE